MTAATELPGAPTAHPSDHDREVQRETFTMALYLCLVMGAEFVVLDEYIDQRIAAIGTIWGTALGLAFAHVFAFGLASRVFAGGPLNAEARKTMRWQLGAAFGLAGAFSVPFLFFDVAVAFDVDSILVAGFITFTVYRVARAAGSSEGRAFIDGTIMLALAAAVIFIKAALTH